MAQPLAKVELEPSAGKDRRIVPPCRGVGGKRSRLTIRLPPDVRGQLEELSASLHRPQWRVIVEAIQRYAASHASVVDR